MPKDPYIREKYTKERTAARKLAAEYFQRFPKDRYQTEVESWRELQSQNIEFTMKRLREPVESADSHFCCRFPILPACVKLRSIHASRPPANRCRWDRIGFMKSNMTATA
jgi:hypothetical protein